jgi:hypothetical protein
MLVIYYKKKVLSADAAKPGVQGITGVVPCTCTKEQQRSLALYLFSGRNY